MDGLKATVGDSPDTMTAVVEENDQNLEAEVGEAPDTLTATVEES
jgi:hypothetical protein